MTKPIYFLRYFAAEKRTNVNLVIDIGNTVAKLAIFDGDEVVEVLRGSNHSLDCLTMLCNKYPIERGIIASVITLSNTIRRQLAKLHFQMLELTWQTPVPIQNKYRSPQTLGMDRWQPWWEPITWLRGKKSAGYRRGNCPDLRIH